MTARNEENNPVKRHTFDQMIKNDCILYLLSKIYIHVVMSIVYGHCH